MPDIPDLTSELDAAEEIVMGRAETVVTEWGGRNMSGGIGCYGSGPDNERQARANAAADGLYRRTVTYGPWEETP